MAYVFGPVPSRRLGLSLGVDLIPVKSCTYDCLYCQVGQTTDCLLEPGPLVPIQEVIRELDERLRSVKPDIITFSGSGEPTLHSEIDQVISFIRGRTDTPIALLTNGSLLWREEVRKRILDAHIIMPTLSTASEETFKRIHRPHSGLKLQNIIDGITRLRESYRGRLFLEVVLLAGMNDSDEEIRGLKKVFDRINPDRIQLNTVVRPPADSRALSLDRERLEDIKKFFGEKCEIIADIPPQGTVKSRGLLFQTIAGMARRRPIRALDVANVFKMPEEDADGLLKGLLIKGNLRRREHAGEIFYFIETPEKPDEYGDDEEK